MPKLKMPRKSTFVDMTAMTDVAFLLLSFFILTTKFKAPEIVEVETPSSVSTKAMEGKNVVLVTMGRDGKVYFSVSDDNAMEKVDIIEFVNQQKQLNLTDAEKAAFTRAGNIVGVPFSQLKSYLALPAEDAATFTNFAGIPVDTANNELALWVRAATEAFQGKKMNLMVKGDNNAKYPAFQGIMKAFKENEQLKFQLITNPEGVPEGTDLWRSNQGGAKTEEE